MKVEERRRLDELAQPPVRIARVPAGGGGRLVTFSIDAYYPPEDESADQSTGVAVCTPRWLLCGGSVPGKDSYGKIEVIDVMGCLFNEDAADLAGRMGYAAWMKPTSAEADELTSADPYADTGCRWVCLGLCCP